MSNLSSSCLPENIRRCMPADTRKELKAPTNADADAKFTAKREKELQEQIANLLRQRNIYFFRQRMDKRTTGRVGQPDFIFAIKGVACACEVKMPGGLLSIEQCETISELHMAGWRTWIARSLEEFIAWLNAIEKEADNG